MKYLLLLSSCSTEEERLLLAKSRVGLQNSIICFQRNLYDGLLSIVKDTDSIDILNMYPIGTYPKYYTDLFIDGYTQKNYTSLPIINLPIIKQLYSIFQANKFIKKWIKSNANNQKIIIMYDLLYPYLKVLSTIKCKNLITCSIIADLPNEYGYHKNERGLKAFIKQRLGNESLTLVSKLNCLGILTKQMSKPLNISNERTVVIEGFSNKNRFFTMLPNCKKTIILYTGLISKEYGIDTLLKSFCLIDDNSFELWICGAGDAIQEIIKYSTSDSRIKYLGYKSQDEIENLQSQASILINPRQNVGEYTKYSFPSKIIEYLSTARPTIAYKLDGIPDIYYNYLFCPKDNSVNALKELIVEVANLPYNVRKQRGLDGRSFILNRTNPAVQMKKLIELCLNMV